MDRTKSNDGHGPHFLDRLVQTKASGELPSSPISGHAGRYQGQTGSVNTSDWLLLNGYLRVRVCVRLLDTAVSITTVATCHICTDLAQ